jgi:hypothetical protein
LSASVSAALTSSIPQRTHLVLVEQPAPIVRKRVITSRIRKLSEAMSTSGCASQATHMRSPTITPLAAAANSIESTR